MAAIFHGIKGRVLRGTAASSHARERAQSFVTLARLAREIKTFCLRRGLHYTLYTTDLNFHDFFLRASADFGLRH